MERGSAPAGADCARWDGDMDVAAQDGSDAARGARGRARSGTI